MRKLRRKFLGMVALVGVSIQSLQTAAMLECDASQIERGHAFTLT